MFMGKTNLFYFGFVLVIIGAVCALVLNHDDAKIPQTNEAVLKGLFDSFTLIFRRPRLGLGVIVKAINDIGKFGYVIVMPIYLIHYGYSTSEWLTVWAIVNIVGYFFSTIYLVILPIQLAGVKPWSILVELFVGLAHWDCGWFQLYWGII